MKIEITQNKDNKETKDNMKTTTTKNTKINSSMDQFENQICLRFCNKTYIE